MLAFLHLVLEVFTNYAIEFFEFVGVIILVLSGLKGIVNYIRKSPSTKIELLKGMAMGLEFKLGSEILRTVIVREINEIIIVGAIIALRAILTFLIHWEIKVEQNSTEEI